MNRKTQNIESKIKSILMIGIASVFIGSGTIDIISDNSDDIFFRREISYQNPEKEKTDNYEVLQGIGKGLVGIISIVLNAITKTTIVSRKDNLYNFRSTSKIILKSNNKIVEEEDSLVAEYFHIQKEILKLLVLSRLAPKHQERITISDIHIFKEINEIEVRMDSEVEINDNDKDFIDLLMEKLSEILETIVTEKMNRIGEYCLNKKTNLENAINNVFYTQFNEIKEKSLSVKTYEMYLEIKNKIVAPN